MDSVNGGIHVAAGQPAHAIATVNGSILADDYAVMKTARTVNGNIIIGAHATADSLTTVNGAITLQPGARVSGRIGRINHLSTKGSRHSMALGGAKSVHSSVLIGAG